MKMARWVLQDSGKGEVFILKGENPENSVQKSIYRHPKTELKLLYNQQNRMIGYLFKYKPGPFPGYALFNNFGIRYSEKPHVDPSSLELDIIYEDQVIRLLSFIHKDRHKTRDFWLVGRWRTENIHSDEELEEAEGEAEEQVTE
jgi:hypothetical protein